MNFRVHLAGFLCSALCMAGCTSSIQSANPSFALEVPAAKAALDEMHAHPKPLVRPVVVIGGIYDPGFQSSSMAAEVRKIAGDDAPVLHITCALDGTFDRCAQRIIADVNKAWPSVDPQNTVEVDVIGFSMGGLVARYAASEDSAEKLGCRLHVNRLFTVSSPHQGASLAVVPTFDQRVIDMRCDSDFLARLNAEPIAYQLIPYARLGDKVVGEENAAPPGQVAWWLPKQGLASHMMAAHDPRILADIARRLRDEAAYTTEPRTPIPAS
jgi:hypothetical protein